MQLEGLSFGGAVLVAAPPCDGDRFEGWQRADVDFAVWPTFQPYPEIVFDEVAAADQSLIRAGEAPSPRLALKRIFRPGHLLNIEVEYCDWAFVSAIQDRLFEHEARPDAGLRDAWTRSSESLIAQGARSGFSHHLCVHPIVITSDDYVVAGLRGFVSNQSGRVSLSFEEQMNAPHVSTRGISSAGMFERIDGDGHPFDAVLRGLREELGIGADDSCVRILGVVVEDSSIAVGIIARVRLAEDLAAVIASWGAASHKSEARILSADDSPRLTGCNSVLSDLPRWMRDTGPLGMPWHSTSRMRLLLALFAEHGIDTTRAALHNV